MYNADTVVTKLRTRYTQFLLIVLILSPIVTILLEMGQPVTSPLTPIFLPLIVVCITLLYLVTRRRFATFAMEVTVLLLLVLTFGISDSVDQVLPLISLLLLAAISAAVLARPFFFWMMQGLLIMRLLWHALIVLTSEQNLMDGLVVHFSAFVLLALIPLMAGAIVRIFTNALVSIARAAQRNARLLQAGADVSQMMAQVVEQDDLLTRAAEIIRDRFGYYHVQIFLLDAEQRYAYLQASTGELGERLLERGHRIPIDALSVIGRVVQAAEPIVANQTATDPNHVTNERLPNTRSELALPITDGKEVLGALDVQSTRPNAFTDDEVRALDLITIQLATTLRNARLFDQQEQNVQANKRLFIESEMSLREIQRLNRQLTQRVWDEYLETRREAQGLTLREGDLVVDTAWTDRMKQARLRRRPISEVEGDVIVTAVPIELQGDVVGVIEIETPKHYETEELRDMMQIIAQRLAITVENARLFEETQQATAQEQRIGQIVAQYQSANTVDELLRLTLKGLAETLGAEEGAIRLGTLPKPPGVGDSAKDAGTGA